VERGRDVELILEKKIEASFGEARRRVLLFLFSFYGFIKGKKVHSSVNC